MLFDPWPFVKNILEGLGFHEEGFERLVKHSIPEIGKIVVIKMEKDQYEVQITGKDDVKVRPDTAVGLAVRWAIHFAVKEEMAQHLFEREHARKDPD